MFGGTSVALLKSEITTRRGLFSLKPRPRRTLQSLKRQGNSREPETQRIISPVRSERKKIHTSYTTTREHHRIYNLAPLLHASPKALDKYVAKEEQEMSEAKTNPET